jgi:hypothetical protein
VRAPNPIDTEWLRQQMTRHRAMRLPCETYDAILACLDELDSWRKAHDASPVDGEVSAIGDSQ